MWTEIKLKFLCRESVPNLDYSFATGLDLVQADLGQWLKIAMQVSSEKTPTKILDKSRER